MAGGPRTGSAGRIFASLARRASQFAHPDPFDIEVFAGQRARLYPRDNLCEKRVFARPDSWDREERDYLSRVIGEQGGEAPLIFVDAGANVGLYSLFILGEARSMGRDIRILAIEPDPVNRQRLAFNIEASGAENEVRIVDKALGARDESGHLVFSGKNRGEIHLATGKELERREEIHGATKREADDFVKVDIVSLATLLEDENINTIDILKIDIEGGEATVFEAFFETAGRALFPRWIVLETISSTGAAALQACRAAGYEIALQTRMNAVLELRNQQDET